MPCITQMTTYIWHLWYLHCRCDVFKREGVMRLLFNLGYLGGSCFFQLHLTLFIAVDNLSFHRQAQKCNCIYGSGFADDHHSEDEDRAVTHRGSQGTFTHSALSPQAGSCGRGLWRWSPTTVKSEMRSQPGQGRSSWETQRGLGEVVNDLLPAACNLHQVLGPPALKSDPQVQILIDLLTGKVIWASYLNSASLRVLCKMGMITTHHEIITRT